MNIRQKLLIASLLLVLLPVLIASLVIGYFSINSSQESLEQSAQTQLIASRDARKNAIESYFGELGDQLISMSENLMVVDAMQDFETAFKSLPLDNVSIDRAGLVNYYTNEYGEEYKERNQGESFDVESLYAPLPEREIYFQNLYISGNPNPLGSKELLNAASDGSEYSSFHAKYHPVFKEYLERFKLYDIFLVDSDNGNIVYSVFKELDYATSLKTGPYKDSGIGRAFAKGNAASKGSIELDDYKPYIPSYNDQAVFISTPIFSNGQKLGVLIYQAPIDEINNIMTSNYQWQETGFGESGETYLVGQDNLLRNESRFLIEDKQNYIDALRNTDIPTETVDLISGKNTSIGLQSVATTAVNKALAGTSGFETFPDYRNVEVLSAYTPINVFGERWALMSEIDVEEAFRPATDLTKRILYTALAALVILSLLGIFLALRFVKTLSTPITELDSTIREINSGNLESRVNVTSQDELGELGNAINQLMDEKVGSLAEAEADNEKLNNNIINLLRSLDKVTDKDFTVSIPVTDDIMGTVAASLNTLTEETSDVLRDMTTISNQVSTVSNEVNDSSDNVIKLSSIERETIGSMVQELEAATQNMLSIAGEAQNANTIAETTIENTKDALLRVSNSTSGINSIRETIFETEKRIKRLGERSQEISSIVSLINNIAERTHILALNASMHAASAGEAGRGFAVVADEVQRLAENAKQSTEEISGLVNNIKTETFDAVNAMNNVITQVASGTKLAEEASEAMNKTEASTNELVALVQQISTNALRQADASVSIRDKANDVRDQALETEKSLNAQKASTQKLQEYSEALNESVSVFTLPAA